ncbi:MAG: hypothetical protein LQ344_007679 [Seirophora lacunosa]|nr:MAG: hypothetical protein LQ344_007679 [Seirophora lacunosa]
MALTAASFAATTFDYLIAGGGTAGLTLAARLSENPAVTVGVIEAGVDRSNDPKVLTPGLAATMWGDENYDWIYKTVPQTNGREVAHPRGKLLGGSSGINLNLWTHASRRDIDDWGLLGNKGWSWADLFPFYKRSENYIPPPPADVEAEAINFVDPACHGEGGPVQTKFPPFYSEFYDAWSPTYANLNLSVDSDLRCGLGLGGATTLATFDKENARSYAGNTYYSLSKNRPNLKILTDALVTKVNFYRRKDSAGKLRVEGLSFRSGRRTRTVKASREVILSAGTFQSPQLLELSGIGSAAVLGKNNIPVLYENPAVGENLQDHLLLPLSFTAAPGLATQESLRNVTLFNEALALYANERTGPLASETPTAHLSYAQLLSTLPPELRIPVRRPPTPHSSTTPGASQGAAQQYELTLNKLLSPTEAAGQILFIPGGTTPAAVANTSLYLSTPLPGNYFTLFGALERPFSRGSVHIVSSDPAAKPAVDPAYLSHPLDLLVASTIVLHMQALARTHPLASLLAGNGTVPQPGFPEAITLANVASFVKGAFSSEYHPLGTCAMAPLRGGGVGGGVVDERFRVYGTSGLRVVDASVAPLMVRGNLASLVYALAERGAGFIMEDGGR